MNTKRALEKLYDLSIKFNNELNEIIFLLGSNVESIEKRIGELEKNKKSKVIIGDTGVYDPYEPSSPSKTECPSVNTGKCGFTECEFCNPKTEQTLNGQIRIIIGGALNSDKNSIQLADEIINLIRSHQDPSKVSIDRKVAEEWVKRVVDENGRCYSKFDKNMVDALKQSLQER